jgi:hypothetical protein
MKDSLIIYRSFYEAVKELPKENQADIWMAICEYSLNGIQVELSGISKTIFILIKPQLDANLKRFENGKKGGRPAANETKQEPKNNLNVTEIKPNYNQDVTKPEPNKNNNNNVNNNVNNNLNNNKGSIAEIPQPQKFDIKESELSFREKAFRTFPDIDKNEVEAFVNYWTEKTLSGKKMKFQLQKTFEVKKRMATWLSNKQKWNKENTAEKSQSQKYEEIMQKQTEFRIIPRPY